MASPTPNLNLGRPDDGDTTWGDDYRSAMDVLDAHPGVALVDAEVDLPDPAYDGQVVLVRATKRLMTYDLTLDEWSSAPTGKQVFVQDTEPPDPGADALWVQTGLGMSGDNIALRYWNGP